MPGAAPLDLGLAILVLFAAATAWLSARLSRVGYVVASLSAALWLALELAPILAAVVAAGVIVAAAVEGYAPPPPLDFGRLLTRLLLLAVSLAVAGVALVRLVDARVSGLDAAFPVLTAGLLASLAMATGRPGPETSRPARLALVVVAVGWMALHRSPDAAAAFAVALAVPLVAALGRAPAVSA